MDFIYVINRKLKTDKCLQNQKEYTFTHIMYKYMPEASIFQMRQN